MTQVEVWPEFNSKQGKHDDYPDEFTGWIVTENEEGEYNYRELGRYGTEQFREAQRHADWVAARRGGEVCYHFAWRGADPGKDAVGKPVRS